MDNLEAANTSPSAHLKRHRPFRAGEGIGVLRAVDAARVELVHDARLRYLAEAERREELRREREHRHVGRLQHAYARERALNQHAANPLAAARLAHGHALQLHGRLQRIADLWPHLVGDAARKRAVWPLGHEEAVDVLHHVAQRTGHQLDGMLAYERVDALRVRQLRSPYLKFAAHLSPQKKIHEFAALQVA